MKNKKSLKLAGLLAAILISVSQPVLAAKEKGGGAGVVCRDKSGNITSVRTLDLYQYEITNEVDIVRSNDPVDQQTDRAIKLFKHPNHILSGVGITAVEYDVRDNLRDVEKGWNLLPANLNLYKKYDLGDDPILIEDGCEPQWVAYYDENGKISVVSKLYNLMSPTDQAALKLHEAIYKLERDLSRSEDSSKVRKLVSRLFSKNPSLDEVWSLSEKIRYKVTDTFVVDAESELFIFSASGRGANIVYKNNIKLASWYGHIDCATDTPWMFGSFSESKSETIYPSTLSLLTTSIAGTCKYLVAGIRIEPHVITSDPSYFLEDNVQWSLSTSRQTLGQGKYLWKNLHGGPGISQIYRIIYRSKI